MMSVSQQGSRAAARVLRSTTRNQQIRRYASDSHGAGHGHGHGNTQSALHVEHANPSGNESLGKGFYYTLAAVPFFYVAYNLAYSPSDNFVARQYQKYKAGQQANHEAEVLHTAALAQAIGDRARVSSYPREVSVRQVTNQEMLNAGSPWNLAVGQNSANLKDLEEYYKTKNAEAEQERLQRYQNGKPVSAYD